MPDKHQHAHDTTGPNVLIATALNFVISVAEIIGGLMSSSLALLSDALHNFSDTFSLIVAWISDRISHRPSDSRRTYGYKRAEVIGALINTVLLLVVSFFLFKSAIERFLKPVHVESRIMLIIAIIGLAGNLISALILRAGSKESINIKAAFLHLVSDVVSSLAVIAGSLVIMKWKLYFIDSLFALLIAGYVLVQGIGMLNRVFHVLMQGVPDTVDFARLIKKLAKVPGVKDTHHMHIWSMNEKDVYLEGHILLDKTNARKLERIKKSIKKMLHDEFSIHHSTLEFEFNDCEDKTCG